MLNQEFWSKYFKVYDVLNFVIPYQNLLSSLEQELSLSEKDILLDVGSGTGNLMQFLNKKCGNIAGVDFSDEGINIHREKNPTANIILHDITKRLPFDDDFFTKVVSNNTIYTLEKENQFFVMSEIYRVLKPGGKVVISNVKKDFSPFLIYKKHIEQSCRKNGSWATLFAALKMIFPTLKMLFYNKKIKDSGITEKYNFMDFKEQKDLLIKSGFVKVSDGKFVYANQAILTTGYKI